MPAPLLFHRTMGLAALFRATLSLLPTLFRSFLTAFSCSHVSISVRRVSALIQPPGGPVSRRNRASAKPPRHALYPMDRSARSRMYRRRSAIVVVAAAARLAARNVSAAAVARSSITRRDSFTRYPRLHETVETVANIGTPSSERNSVARHFVAQRRDAQRDSRSLPSFQRPCEVS